MGIAKAICLEQKQSSFYTKHAWAERRKGKSTPGWRLAQLRRWKRCYLSFERGGIMASVSLLFPPEFWASEPVYSRVMRERGAKVFVLLMSKQCSINHKDWVLCSSWWGGHRLNFGANWRLPSPSSYLALRTCREPILTHGPVVRRDARTRIERERDLFGLMTTCRQEVHVPICSGHRQRLQAPMSNVPSHSSWTAASRTPNYLPQPSGVGETQSVHSQTPYFREQERNLFIRNVRRRGLG